VWMRPRLRCGRRMYREIADTLEKALSCGNPNTGLRAAIAILGFTLKFEDEESIRAQIDYLEAMLNEIQMRRGVV
jgi:hypothetical protein